MKLRLVLLLLFFLLAYSAVKAQVINNLVVFCNEGERFTLILNGLKENPNPETNVRVEGLDLKVYEVKIIFENHKLKDHSTTLTFYRTGKECVFALNKHGKKHTMDYVSEKEIDGFLMPVNTEMPVNIINTMTTPTPNNNTETQIQTTTTITTVVNNIDTPFQTTIGNIVAQPTEQGKLNAALAALENKTFSIAQIKQVLSLFSNEQSRLAFAKQVCAKAKDPAIYTTIMDTFINEAVKQEFKKFIDGKK